MNSGTNPKYQCNVTNSFFIYIWRIKQNLSTVSNYYFIYLFVKSYWCLWAAWQPNWINKSHILLLIKTAIKFEINLFTLTKAVKCIKMSTGYCHAMWVLSKICVICGVRFFCFFFICLSVNNNKIILSIINLLFLGDNCGVKLILLYFICCKFFFCTIKICTK